MESLINLLLDPEKVHIVLQSISSYIAYIYPGIISIYWNNFLEAKSTKNTQALLIKSFSISFLYNIFLGLVLNYNKIIAYNTCLIVISIICPYLYNKFKYSSVLRVICEFLRIRTCLSSVPFELLKTCEEKFTCLKIYLNDDFTVYIGFMDQYEYEEDKEKFIILTGYKKYVIDKNKEKIVVNNNSEQYDQKVFIKYSEIKTIEKIAEDIAFNKIYNKK